MCKVKLKLALLGALSVVSAQALATGLVALPSTGASGTSAYLACSSGLASAPTLSTNNNCAVFPANEATSPVAGFTIVASANRPIIVNNSYTNFTNVTIGNLADRVWRNAANTECIYFAKIVPANIDYRPTVAGNQYFIFNDIARGGFAESNSVEVGYFNPITTPRAKSVVRIGRSYTSVQINGLPSFGSSDSINSTLADVNSNWIDFKLRASWNGDIFTSSTYVKAGCNNTLNTVPNAIRIRQTEGGFIEVSMPGYAPPLANAEPTPIVPF